MKTVFLFFASFASACCFSQEMITGQTADPPEKHANRPPGCQKSQNVRIVFYNVENLYDPYDDTTKLDNEFTPEGDKHWNYSRFQAKLNHLSKTLMAIGGWEPPPIIGLCEVENRYVLNKLIYQTPLKKFNYRFVHHDSPDSRGIDVILLYRPALFSLVSATWFKVRFPFDTAAQTRELLMVKGKVFESDTIILFINHWPSRRGGYAESQPRRNFVAGLLRSKIDSVLMRDRDPNIIITGDFNDEPDKASLKEVLNAMPPTDTMSSGDLVNLMYPVTAKWNEGTIRYQGQWSVFDQFIVSGNLVRSDKNLHAIFADAHIFKAGFLTEKDDRNLGEKLKRTYAGPRYLGGFSDHLPVYLDLWKMEVR